MTTEAAHWGYSGTEAPQHWGCLSEAYRPCSEGVEQSPVNITACEPGEGPGLAFDYHGQPVTARNNGHTVYLDFASGNTLDIDGQSYELQGIHYHSPGEHEVEGERFAAELHLVHQDENGRLAVVGLLFRSGSPSASIQSILDAAPHVGDTVDIEEGRLAASYVPDRRGYFTYAGSLTTPPCTEGVRWIVMQSVDTVSQEQVDALQAITGGPNNRPVQPIGDRAISSVGS